MFAKLNFPQVLLEKILTFVWLQILTMDFEKLNSVFFAFLFFFFFEKLTDLHLPTTFCITVTYNTLTQKIILFNDLTVFLK